MNQPVFTAVELEELEFLVNRHLTEVHERRPRPPVVRVERTWERESRERLEALRLKIKSAR